MIVFVFVVECVVVWMFSKGMIVGGVLWYSGKLLLEVYN